MIAGIITLAAVGGMTNNVAKENASNGHTPGTGSGYTPATGSSGGGHEQTARINEPVRDGKFEFVVTGVDNGGPNTTASQVRQVQVVCPPPCPRQA